MSLNDLVSALENTPEIGPVPGDQEYRLRLQRFWMGTQDEAKGGRQYFMASVEFPDEPLAAEMTIFIGFKPYPGNMPPNAAELSADELAAAKKDSAKQMEKLRKFLAVWNIPFSLLTELDESQERPTLKAVVGLEVRALVGLQDSNRNAGEKENFVKQYLA